MGLLAVGLHLLRAGTAGAQSPVLGVPTPTRNAPAAPRTSNVVLPFSQNIDGSTAPNIGVFSSFAGKRAGTYSTAGSTVTFAPTGGFRPGEQLFTTVPATVRSTGAVAASKQVFQFTAAAGGTGRGTAFDGNQAVLMPSGDIANCVALGDVDNDGDLDMFMASGNSADNFVHVRKNDGTGTFATTGQRIPVGYSPRVIILGDFNGDGALDAVVANNSGYSPLPTLSLLLNTGSGTLGTASSVVVADAPLSVVGGDVNGDGYQDLISQSSGGITSVRLNTGNGTFVNSSQGASFSLGGGGSVLTLGDVDNDGDLDLLFVGSSYAIGVRLNDGNGGFATVGQNVTAGTFPQSIALSDLDSDGDLDLLVANSTGTVGPSSTVSVRLNTGGTFAGTGQAVPVSNSPRNLAVGDFDGDGDPDFAVTNTLTNLLNVRLNDGTGTFGSTGQDVPTGQYCYTVAAGDVDGDNDLDMVATNQGSFLGNGGSSISVHLNQVPEPAVITGFAPASGPVGSNVVISGSGLYGSNVFFNGTPVSSYPSVSGTSLTVVVPAGATTGLITLTGPGGAASTSTAFTVVLRVTGLSPVRNARAASATAPVAVTLNLPPTAASVGGVTVFSAQYMGRRTAPASLSGSTITLTPTGGPFRPGEVVSVSVPATIVSSDGTMAQPHVFQFTTAVGGTGTGTAFAAAPDVPVGTAPKGVATGDVDGDGTLDLLTANSSAGTVSVRLNNGAGTFAGTQTVAVGTGPAAVALGDVDNDGDLDVVTANAGAGTASVRFNNSGTFAGSQDVAVGAGPAAVALADVDGDLDLDLLTANATDGTLSVRLNNGSGTFAGTQTVTVGSGPTGLALGDVDADGDLDALVTNGMGATVSLRLNDGTGLFTGTTDMSVGNGPQALVLGDVDGDNDLDLLTANATDGNVSMRLNNGAGVFAGPQTVASGNSLVGLALGDLDGDGDLDLLAASADGTVRVRLNSSTGFFLVGPADVPVGAGAQALALGDLDGDGDLDLLAANATDGTVRVRLNDAPVPTISYFTPTSGIVGTPVTLNGDGFTGATAVALNGTAVTGFVVLNATRITFAVPAGATTGRITVTTPKGTGTSSTDFVVFISATAFVPARNATAAPVGTAVAVTFDQVPTLASTGNIAVFSAQYKGRRAATASVSGSTATLGLTGGPFRPGEVVSVSVPATVVSAAGATTRRQVYQFSTAVSAAGGGTFADPAVAANGTVAVGTGPKSVVTGDIDGDGDLDLLTSYGNASTGSVAVRLNNGQGVFEVPIAIASVVTVGSNPLTIALGDVDRDGDLDLVVANSGTAGTGANSVGVYANDGQGNFTSAQSLALTVPRTVMLGDVNGDGYLDLLAFYSTTFVAVRLNDGTGAFPTTTQNLNVGGTSLTQTLGDVDNDGDLDLLSTAGNSPGVVRTFANNGTGTFATTSQNVVVGTNPRGLALGDLNADGYPDLVVANLGSANVSVRLNDGTGTFGGTQNVATGTSPLSVALGDVDGDGDLDLLAANSGASIVSVRLNTGGVFAASGQNVSVNNQPQSVALGDVDGDGDLDLLAACSNGGSSGGAVSVRLNQPPPLAVSGLSPASELPGQPVTLTGTGFVSGSTVAFGGVAASSVVVNSSTSLTATVPAGAAPGSSTVVVTRPDNTTATAPAFTVLQVYSVAGACQATEPYVATGDNKWHYLLTTNGQVVAALQDTRAALGTVTASFLVADQAAAVRRDAGNRYYLDRNFALTASGGRFDGSTVNVRFYGLASEFTRLQAVDASVTYAALKATQYSGPNEDCDLANNGTPSERRTLPAPASAPAGTPYFVAELAVADHFSEFYLTGSPTPLPVELTAFTATAEGSRAVRLAWATASEKNSARFEVERSLDGRAFAAIGTVAAAGSSSTARSYGFLDAQVSKFPSTQPPVGTSQDPIYYRLRQVDADGSSFYSTVRVVVVAGAAASPAAQLLAYPNPAHEAVRVLVTGEGGASVQLYDALGREVRTAPTVGTEAVVSVAGLPAGIYVLRCGTLAQRLTVE